MGGKAGKFHLLTKECTLRDMLRQNPLNFVILGVAAITLLSGCGESAQPTAKNRNYTENDAGMAAVDSGTQDAGASSIPLANLSDSSFSVTVFLPALAQVAKRVRNVGRKYSSTTSKRTLNLL